MMIVTGGKPLGFRATELALYHVLGKLPEPNLAHVFTDEPLF
jgi:hypothetical protein